MSHKPQSDAWYDPQPRNLEFASFLERVASLEQVVVEFEVRLRALEEVVGGEGLGAAGAASTTSFYCEECEEFHEP